MKRCSAAVASPLQTKVTLNFTQSNNHSGGVSIGGRRLAVVMIQIHITAASSSDAAR